MMYPRGKAAKARIANPLKNICLSSQMMPIDCPPDTSSPPYRFSFIFFSAIYICLSTTAASTLNQQY